MASLHPPSDSESHVFTRLAQNVGWLLRGKGFGGLISLFYLAAAARALGPTSFGVFALVLTYAQLLANLIQFQSWKAVIRFGATHASGGHSDRLARLLGFMALLDWTAALGGTVIAGAGAFLIAPVFGWSAGIRVDAALFAAALLLTTGATPSGMLRLFDRFDLLAYAEATAPVVRLIGAIAVWLSGGGVPSFLLVWVLAASIQTVVTWIAALRIHRARVSTKPAAVRLAIRENPGVWKFMWHTSLASSLGFIWMQAGVLAVGAWAGPDMAGGYRLADRIAGGIAKPAETFTRALYPELARLVAHDDRERLRSLFRQTVRVALVVAILLIFACAAEGRSILRLVAGDRFVFAQQFLVVLAISAAVDVAGVALEPVLNAHGKASAVLRARITGAAVYILLLLSLLPMIGPIGAAWAAAVSCAVMVSQLSLSARSLLQKG